MKTWKKKVFAAAAALCLGTIAIPGVGGTAVLAASPYADRLHFFRFLEDYSDITDADRAGDWYARLKNMPLGAGTYPYLTLGGDYRFRFENFDNQFFGLVPNNDTSVFLNRVMLHGDLHVTPWLRGFAQFSYFTQHRRVGRPTPFDQSAPDLQQGFVDIGGKDLWARLGRQELVLGSGKLTDVREGPNQRLSFDAARLHAGLGLQGAVDIFYAREVVPTEEGFQDGSRDGSQFWGAYFTGLIKPTPGTSLDLYYFGIDRKNSLYEQGVAYELRHTVAAFLTGKEGGWSFEYEALYQFGTFGRSDIRAWGLRTENRYTFRDLTWRPQVGILANVTSGDSNAADGKLGTFDAPFPNPSYTTDASFLRPRNFYELHFVASATPHETVSLDLGVNFLWRQSTADAVYAPATFRLVAAPASERRFIAALLDVGVTYTPTPHITVQATFTHAFAGDVVRDAGGADANFLHFQVGIKF